MLPIADDATGRGGAIATWTLIALCAAGFAARLVFNADALLIRFAFVPGLLFGGAQMTAGIPVVPPPVTLVTYVFLHAGWLHLLGNLLFLWIFGPRLERTLGGGAYTTLFIAGGVIAALAQAASDPSSGTPVVGASGAVAAVLGAYLVLHPRSEISVLVPLIVIMQVVELPAWVVLAAWFVAQMLYAVWMPAGSGGIAFEAHLGGFVAGVVYAAGFMLMRIRTRRLLR